MGHHTTINPLLVIIRWHQEEALPIAAKNCPPLPHITTEMLIHTVLMVYQSLLVLIPATKGSVLLPVQLTGAGHQVTADTVLMNKESLGPVLMQAEGDPEVPTGNLLAQAQMSDVLPGPAAGVHIPPPDILAHEVATATLALVVVHPAFPRARSPSNPAWPPNSASRRKPKRLRRPQKPRTPATLPLQPRASLPRTTSLAPKPTTVRERDVLLPPLQRSQKAPGPHQ